jgi:carbonic anhydrase
MDLTWEEKYKELINNDTRNYDAGSAKSYPICSSTCNFDVTKLKEKNYIRGLTASTTANLLHINPIVNTNRNGDTEKRNQDDEMIYLNYSFRQSGDIQKYRLIDIFFRTPSKTVIKGKRYEMEVCLVFVTGNRNLFVVVCVPINVSPHNNTTEPDEKDLFKFFNSIANNFPKKNKTSSIKDVLNWNPLMFFPPRKGKNASFYTWLDPTTNDTVMYIQFENPITCPQDFFKNFSNNLSGNVESVKKQSKLKAKPTNAELEIYYNVNEDTTPITSQRVCKNITNKEVQNFLAEPEIEPEIEPENNCSKDNIKKSTTEKKKSSWKDIMMYILYIFVGILTISIIVIYLISSIKYFKNSQNGFINYVTNISNKYLIITSIIELSLIAILIYLYIK